MAYIALLAALLLAGIDQLIKLWAIDNLKGKSPIELIKFGDKKIIDLTYLENNGAVFGSFSGMRIFLLAMTIILLSVCIWFILTRKIKSKIFLWSLASIVGGGVGNLIDRIFRGGAVVDFIEFKFVDFAIFNFADICVTLGTVVLFVYLIFFDKPKNKNSGVES